jgi:hypothetical protein
MTVDVVPLLHVDMPLSMPFQAELQHVGDISQISAGIF